MHSPPEWIAVVLLGAAIAIALLRGGQIVRRALEVSQARSERRLESSQALYGARISHAHDDLRGVERALEDLAASGVAAAAGSASAAATDRIRRLRESMAATHVARGSYEGGRAPLVAGNAEGILKRLGESLKTYSWTPSHLLPARLRGVGTQTSMVIDEVRVLHNAEIERSVLLLTLVARAVLVTLAPLLAGWTSADTPLVDTGMAADLLWIAAAAVSLTTLALAPRVVDLAMTESPEAKRFRGRLLWIEVPIALAVLVALPAWPVVVFAAGWTNWWQRQTENLAFDWRKLIVFVAAVVGLEAVGLTLQSIDLQGAAVEIAASLVAIAVIGGSYGAMLPLTIATGIGVVVGDGARAIRIARGARTELLDCSRQLALTAARIEAAAPGVPLARNAATLARQSSEKLAREADLFGRRGVLARQVLAELFDQAVSRSNLPRRDSGRYGLALAAAHQAAQPEPAYAVEPILGELALARVAQRRHAQALQHFLLTALNEAAVHGTGGVRILARLRGDVLAVAVGNVPRSRVAGRQSEGSARLARFAARLPEGRLGTAGLRPAEELEFSVQGQWWVVELECGSALLTPST